MNENQEIKKYSEITNVPNHVALVMDGNGRWAENRGLKRTDGHKEGEKVLLNIVEEALKIGIKHLSVYAFSTENWLRSPAEVKFLMGFNRDVLSRQRDYLHSLGVKIKWAGREPKLWKSVISQIKVAEKLTKNNQNLQLNMCINYGGQFEIIDGINKILEKVNNGELKTKKITRKEFEKFMYIPDMPPVDLFLRPSGEQRISNFLLWQIAYAEFVFQEKLFPDFTKEDLFLACVEYSRRSRRFGA